MYRDKEGHRGHDVKFFNGLNFEVRDRVEMVYYNDL
jgi:hypothetical protein